MKSNSKISTLSFIEHLLPYSDVKLTRIQHSRAFLSLVYISHTLCSELCSPHCFILDTLNQSVTQRRFNIQQVGVLIWLKPCNLIYLYKSQKHPYNTNKWASFIKHIHMCHTLLLIKILFMKDVEEEASELQYINLWEFRLWLQPLIYFLPTIKSSSKYFEGETATTTTTTLSKPSQAIWMLMLIKMSIALCFLLTSL